MAKPESTDSKGKLSVSAQTRLELHYTNLGLEPYLPEIDEYEASLVNHFKQLGMYMIARDDGAKDSLPWSEIAAYGFVMDLDAWEMVSLSTMSKSYLMGLQTGKDPFGIEPMRNERYTAWMT